MRNWIVVAPAYRHASAGIHAMHRICHTLRETGRNARMAFQVSDDPTKPGSQVVMALPGDGITNPKFDTPSIENLADASQSIVLYPEVITGNPLGGTDVARWFGFKDGGLTGKPVTRGPRDFIIAHSRVVDEGAHHVLYTAWVNPCFNAIGTRPALERTLDMCYVGKGYLWGQPIVSEDEHNSWVPIRRDWPPTQEQLALLLREARFVHTWDPYSAFNSEVVFCGAIPVFRRYTPIRSEDLDRSEVGRIPRVDADNPSITTADYERERAEMMSRTAMLEATWFDRVAGMAECAERHFEGAS